MVSSRGPVPRTPRTSRRRRVSLGPRSRSRSGSVSFSSTRTQHRVRQRPTPLRPPCRRPCLPGLHLRRPHPPGLHLRRPHPPGLHLWRPRPLRPRLLPRPRLLARQTGRALPTPRRQARREPVSPGPDRIGWAGPGAGPASGAVTDKTARDEDMANITAADVKRLRESTGAGMLDCKKALEQADGDLEAAVEILRLKGVKDAGKRATRTAANGLIAAALDGNNAGVMIELNCETDFVAKTDLVQRVAADIAAAALAHKPADRLALLGLEARSGVTAQRLIEEAGASLKEKLELGRYALLEGGYVTSYLHYSDRALPPTVGVLVQLDQLADQAGKDVAQQVAAMRPQYVTRDKVPAEVVEKERGIAEQLTRDEGKPEIGRA